MNIKSFQRIAVIGISCSGKSVLSNKIGQACKYPILHLDQIAFISGTNWVMRTPE